MLDISKFVPNHQYFRVSGPHYSGKQFLFVHIGVQREEGGIFRGMGHSAKEEGILYILNLFNT